jgi:hypothetical protein
MRVAKSRIVVVLLACLAVAAVLGVRALSAGDAGGGARARLAAASVSSAPLRDGSAAKFGFLAHQTSNRCALQPGALAAMPDRGRLQGSCCFPMDLAAYGSQVRGLRSYQDIAEVPRDPYDVAISLAKRLLVEDRMIHLTPPQTRTYRQAMRMSHTKGPCCCPCWRWYAFRGLSKQLIADRGWRPAQVARVIDLVEGCGGPASHA